MEETAFVSYSKNVSRFIIHDALFIGVWLHVEGDNTPNYDANGYVLGPDKTGTLIPDMKSFLNSAKAKNILVIFVLWNGATLRNQKSINLYWDNSKLQTYLDKALTVNIFSISSLAMF
jgi:mannan endo-1,4-beta-mannosidase